MPQYSPYEEWLIDRFGGETPKVAVSNAVDSLIREAGINSFPIKLTEIAKIINLNPAPHYDLCQIYEAMLKDINGVMRISFRRRSFPEKNTASYKRIKFDYAHEILHALGWDLHSQPNKRIAPLPVGREEEILCNYGASRLILPSEIIHKTIDLRHGNPMRLLKLSDLAESGVPTTAIRMADEFCFNISPMTIILISQKNTGHRRSGILKPRCILGLFMNGYGEIKRIPQAYQGIDLFSFRSFPIYPAQMLENINSLNSFQEYSHDEQLKVEGRLYSSSGKHTIINPGRYVFSEYNLQ